jgi:hypothetical protein
MPAISYMQNYRAFGLRKNTIFPATGATIDIVTGKCDIAHSDTELSVTGAARIFARAELVKGHKKLAHGLTVFNRECHARTSPLPSLAK